MVAPPPQTPRPSPLFQVYTSPDLSTPTSTISLPLLTDLIEKIRETLVREENEEIRAAYARVLVREDEGGDEDGDESEKVMRALCRDDFPSCFALVKMTGTGTGTANGTGHHHEDPQQTGLTQRSMTSMRRIFLNYDLAILLSDPDLDSLSSFYPLNHPDNAARVNAYLLMVITIFHELAHHFHGILYGDVHTPPIPEFALDGFPLGPGNEHDREDEDEVIVVLEWAPPLRTRIFRNREAGEAGNVVEAALFGGMVCPYYKVFGRQDFAAIEGFYMVPRFENTMGRHYVERTGIVLYPLYAQRVVHAFINDLPITASTLRIRAHDYEYLADDGLLSQARYIIIPEHTYSMTRPRLVYGRRILECRRENFMRMVVPRKCVRPAN
ncbi:hypothetical protein K474DRAFT_1077509 [Panus rudis PR-1116 ss-1]|nr:hypothetical protein K474DRAFT_1077509 [Panus rudis PR-1116 ss-1]